MCLTNFSEKRRDPIWQPAVSCQTGAAGHYEKPLQLHEFLGESYRDFTNVKNNHHPHFLASKCFSWRHKIDSQVRRPGFLESLSASEKDAAGLWLTRYGNQGGASSGVSQIRNLRYCTTDWPSRLSGDEASGRYIDDLEPLRHYLDY